MVKRTQAVSLDGDTLELAIAKLGGLSTESQVAITSIINKLAQVEGVSSYIDCELPIENIGAWLTKLKSERKSERTVKMYVYLTSHFLRRIPRPSRTDIREYLAKRIDDTSPSSTETERKSLASLFSFLHSEGLWHENLLESVRHIGPRWDESERRCPTMEDVEKGGAGGRLPKSPGLAQDEDGGVAASHHRAEADGVHEPHDGRRGPGGEGAEGNGKGQ